MRCIWSILENALFQNHCCHEIWVPNPLGSQELNKHSQSTDSPCLHRGALPLISVSHPACLKVGLCPWFGSGIRYCSLVPSWFEDTGLFGTSRQPAQPSLALAELPWFQSYMNATEMKFPEDSIGVSVGVLQWMQGWLFGSLNRDTKVLFGMPVQLLILKVPDSLPGLLKHGSKC